MPAKASNPPQQPALIEVALRPGVTDPVAEQIVRAAKELGIPGVQNASTGTRYLAGGRLSEQDLHTLAHRLLANPTIHRYTLGEIMPVFPHPAEASGQVDMLTVRRLDDTGLLALSQERRAALDLAEMQAVQAYFQRQGRDPTDIEFETIAQTWCRALRPQDFQSPGSIDNYATLSDEMKLLSRSPGQ